MTIPLSEVQDRFVNNEVFHSGFRPRLFVVTYGTYASNASYGSGTAAVTGPPSNYDSQTLRGATNGLAQTRATIREQDNDIDFVIEITLDASLSDPGFITGDELRIQVLQPLAANEPGRYLTPLPAPDPSKGLAVFDEVEIVNTATGLLPPGVVPDVFPAFLKARLLFGGELALFWKVSDDISAADVAATVNSIANAFEDPSGTTIKFQVRGTYRGGRIANFL